MKKVNRTERRRIARENNRDGTWVRKTSPKEIGSGDNWFGQMDRFWINDRYCVMARTIKTEWGYVDHACIRNSSSTDIKWSEKQKIKNELWGEEFTAVEVFPKESELVDEANMYHLWIFKDYNLPFTIKV